MVGARRGNPGELNAAPRFIADAMVGRLARWLRVLGYDTLYLPDLDDAGLARRAHAEDRILLTRDVELTRRRGLRTLLIGDDRVEGQLRQVLEELHLSADHAFSRCIQCNARLVACERDEARGQVPPFVFATQSQFRRCPECGRIYWRGTHWAQMLGTLEDAVPGGAARGKIK